MLSRNTKYTGIRSCDIWTLWLYNTDLFITNVSYIWNSPVIQNLTLIQKYIPSVDSDKKTTFSPATESLSHDKENISLFLSVDYLFVQTNSVYIQLCYYFVVNDYYSDFIDHDSLKFFHIKIQILYIIHKDVLLFILTESQQFIFAKIYRRYLFFKYLSFIIFHPTGKCPRLVVRKWVA